MRNVMSEEIVTAAVLVIGNEILSGRTQDANLHYLAQKLGELGIRLREARVVPDVEEEVIAAVNQLRARYTYLFTTGGIGPTHDDITSACVAKAFGASLIRDPKAVALLESHYAPGDLTPARLKMAEVAEGSTLIENPVSKAPGFQIGNVFVLAGVPRIAQAMFDGIALRLKGGPIVESRTVTCGLGEGVIAPGLGAIQAEFPDVDIGSYPYFRRGAFGASLVLRSSEIARLEAATLAVTALVRALGGEPTAEPETD
jgi:molybdenum cofactor synthesis domain-containing protein